MLTLTLSACPIDIENENMYEHAKIVAQYESAYTASQQEIKQLFEQALRVKGDWLLTQCTQTPGKTQLAITLLFEDLLNIENQPLIQTIDMLCKQFAMQRLKESVVCKNNVEDTSEALAIIRCEQRGTVTFGLDKIEETLHRQKLISQICCQNLQTTECGAGGGMEEIVLFVGAAIASGIAWDAIKQSIALVSGFAVDEVFVTLIDKVKYKQLKKAVASRMAMENKLLKLIYFKESKNKLLFKFEAQGTIIEVISDAKYHIKSIKLKPYKTR